MKTNFSDKTTVAVPADQPRAERLADVLDGYMRDLEHGGIPPDLDALAAAHPDLADELRSYADSLKLLHQMTAGLRPLSLPTRPEATSDAGAMTPRRLGDYEILREIGRGGMGVVYEARQISLNRQVALKVLPFAAMLDEKQIARFRNEAQAAAQLHHPNIVPVHAVGQERGVHFFAMQYVAGQSLETALAELRQDAGAFAPHGSAPRSAPFDASAARNAETATFAAFSTRASTRSRGYCQSVAGLLIQAAEALQHAHEYGVIHRDVKPSNLLLDRTGKLWVTDFGLARMQTDSGVTVTGDVVGTLRYMSPEQAAGASTLVDVRADVYSLGATLYELLTLQPAHHGDNRQAVLRHIESREPTPPRALNPAIPLDLETITLRALAKNRDERYATALDFANDLRLFLEGKPTVARRPTIVDRAAKWALRHRFAVCVAASFLLVLSLVSATAAVMIAREKARTDDALAAERASRASAEQSDELAREVVDRFGAGLATELAGVTGAEPVRRRLLGETLAYYRRFIEQTAGDPRLERELARASFKAAAIAESLGDRREAIALCRQSLARFDELARLSTDDESLELERARCHGSLGLMLAAAGDVDAALAAYRESIARQLPRAARAEASSAVVQQLADAYGKLGLLLAETDRKKDARQALQTAIELVERLAQRAPDDLTLRHDLALSYNSLSFVERDLDWTRAEECCWQAIALLQGLAARQESVAAYRADLALCYNNLGAILGHDEKWTAACKSYRQAIELEEQLVRQAPAVVVYRRDLAVSWNNLGEAHDANGAVSAALEAFDEAQHLIAQLVADYPDDVSFSSLLGAVLNNRAMRLEAAGDLAAALDAYEQGIAHQRVAFERAPQMTVYRDALSKHYYNFGRALRAAGRPADAGEAALARRTLWTGDAAHLAQVALELAHAAAETRASKNLDHSAQLADRLEAETAATLREAIDAGDDLAALQREGVFRTLHDSSIWTTITTWGERSRD